MIELVYRPNADLFGDMPDVTEVTMTLGDNISWEAALEEFVHFLKASGYEPPDCSFETEKPAWIPLKITERNRIIEEWQQLTQSVKDTEFNQSTRLCKMIEDKLKELNTQ